MTTQSYEEAVEDKKDVVSEKTITSSNLTSGKKYPASLGRSGVKELTEEEEKEDEKDGVNKNTTIYVPFIKSNNEERTVTGVVLQPEVVDAQGDIMSADVIRKAAHAFLSKYNSATKLGFMHKIFGKYKFDLYQSWIAPHDVVINNTTVKSGSWIMTTYVGDDKIWNLVKESKIKGFSIGGKAKAKKVDDDGE